MTVVEFSAPVETPVEVLTEREQRARTLEAAALEIEYRGWVQGRHCDSAGRVCMIGAITAAQGKSLYSAICLPLAITDSAWEAWFGYKATADREYSVSLPAWNDTRETADDVTFLLRWRAEEIRDGR